MPLEIPALSRVGGAPASAPASAIEFVTAASFEAKVLRAAGPVVVEFMTYACPHCRAMEPVIHEVAAALAGSVKVYQVNVPLDRELSTRYRITGTPTFVMFENGREVGRTLARPIASEVRAAILAPFAREPRNP